MERLYILQKTFKNQSPSKIFFNIREDQDSYSNSEILNQKRPQIAFKLFFLQFEPHNRQFYPVKRAQGGPKVLNNRFFEKSITEKGPKGLLRNCFLDNFNRRNNLKPLKSLKQLFPDNITGTDPKGL